MLHALFIIKIYIKKKIKKMMHKLNPLVSQLHNCNKINKQNIIHASATNAMHRDIKSLFHDILS